jgi:hypothetical protein
LVKQVLGKLLVDSDNCFGTKVQVDKSGRALVPLYLRFGRR